jgi:hypothetical protein
MLAGTRYDEHSVKLSPSMSLAVFSDGLLEVLPQPTVKEKLDFLRGCFGRLDVTIEQVQNELHFGAGATLPDDVALLIIQRGQSHDRTRAA